MKTVCGKPYNLSLKRFIKGKYDATYVSVTVVNGPETFKLNLGSLSKTEIVQLIFDGEQNFRLGIIDSIFSWPSRFFK